MEIKRLVRIALALAVSGSGAAMYTKDAKAFPACGTGVNWLFSANWTAGVCCTSPFGGGHTLCSWGVDDPTFGKHMHGTANGWPSSIQGDGKRWRIKALSTISGEACTQDNQLVPPTGATTSIACPGGTNTAVRISQ